MNEEILKLPICPYCHETKNVKSYDYYETTLSHDNHSAHYCKTCNISWKFTRGIMDSTPCFPCESDATIHHCVYGRAILDNREIKMVRM